MIAGNKCRLASKIWILLRDVIYYVICRMQEDLKLMMLPHLQAVGDVARAKDHLTEPIIYGIIKEFLQPGRLLI